MYIYIYTYSIANGSFSKGVKSCHFSLIDPKNIVTRTHSESNGVPFCPLQVFTAWVRTHAREKLRQSSRNMTSSWPLASEQPLYVWGLGGPISKIKGHLSFCHVFLKVVPKHENGQLDVVPFLQKKSLSESGTGY